MDLRMEEEMWMSYLSQILFSPYLLQKWIAILNLH